MSEVVTQDLITRLDSETTQSFSVEEVTTAFNILSEEYQIFQNELLTSHTAKESIKRYYRRSKTLTDFLAERLHAKSPVQTESDFKFAFLNTMLRMSNSTVDEIKIQSECNFDRPENQTPADRFKLDQARNNTASALRTNHYVLLSYKNLSTTLNFDLTDLLQSYDTVLFPFVNNRFPNQVTTILDTETKMSDTHHNLPIGVGEIDNIYSRIITTEDDAFDTIYVNQADQILKDIQSMYEKARTKVKDKTDDMRKFSMIVMSLKMHALNSKMMKAVFRGQPIESLDLAELKMNAAMFKTFYKMSDTPDRALSQLIQNHNKLIVPSLRKNPYIVSQSEDFDADFIIEIKNQA